jgi:chaperone modulatory protein CbpM
MKNEDIVVGVLIEETTSISFNEVCVKYKIPQALLTEMIEHGIFAHQTANAEHTQLNPNDLRRMESAFRLHTDLGVNLPGVALALDLLDELEAIRKELDILRKHV